MKEKKNIDRLFQEKFKDFEASPKDHVWSTIASELQENKKPRVIPIWWYRIAGVAAVLIAAFLIGNLLINQPQQKVVNTNKKETLQPEIRKNDEPFTNQNKNSSSKTNEAVVNSSTKDNPITPTPEKNNLQDETNTTNTGVKANSNRIVNRSSVEKSSSVKNGGLASTSKTKKNSKNSSAEKETSENSALAYQEQAINSKMGSENSAEENSSAIDKTTNPSTSTTDQLAENTSTSEEKFSDPKDTIEDENTIAEVEQEESDEKTKSLVDIAKEIEEEKNEDEKENEPQLSKWLIKPNVSPIYYGSLNGSNNIDQSLASNSSESDVTMAYGVNFAYAISDKLKVRSGISKVNMSYNVNNIAYSTDVNAVNLQGVTNNSQTQTVEIMSVSNSQPTSADNYSEINRGIIAPTTEGVLNQQLGYLEVPLEVEYALLDKRFGINVIGGASTLFLDDNDISINSENGHLSIGEANNLNSVSFTTNVGLGFDYQLSKKFDINLEPTFKYQLNTYNNNINDFRPYYFGVYTGFSFKF